jgi:hypothetical protein
MAWGISVGPVSSFFFGIFFGAGLRFFFDRGVGLRFFFDEGDGLRFFFCVGIDLSPLSRRDAGTPKHDHRAGRGNLDRTISGISA